MSNYSNAVEAVHKLFRHILGLGPAKMPVLGLDDTRPASEVEEVPTTDGILGPAINKNAS